MNAKLTVKIKYDEPASDRDIRRALDWLMMHAAGEGLLSPEDGTIDTWSYEISIEQDDAEDQRLLQGTDDGDECPLCQCGTVEHADGAVKCRGECGSSVLLEPDEVNRED